MTTEEKNRIDALNYYYSQLEKIEIGKTEYLPTIKIFANGNGTDTNHLSLTPEMCGMLCSWLVSKFASTNDRYLFVLHLLDDLMQIETDSEHPEIAHQLADIYNKVEQFIIK